jgi:hypothetical protein
MSDLDFSELTDDQIVELATALAEEAMRRNPALAAAFEQALVDARERFDAAVRAIEKARIDELERVEAEARGAGAAKAQALKAIEEQAKKAEAEIQKESLRRRNHEAMRKYLLAVAAILDRPVAKITLVYRPSDWGHKGPRIEVNQGSTGELASWHLVQYVQNTESLTTSPAARQKLPELNLWAREALAAIRALGINHSIVLKGIEL